MYTYFFLYTFQGKNKDNNKKVKLLDILRLTVNIKNVYV